MRARFQLFLLLAIFALAFFLRFYKLGEVPFGLYQDESAIGYNAYSILNTGRDEHGVTFPLYFQSFGDWKHPVYIYITAASVWLFGLSEFAVRFPSALLGSLTVVVFYFFVRELTNEKRLALLSTLFLAINPWHLHYSRATFEVSIALFLFVLGGLLLTLAFERGNKGTFFLGTLCFIVSVYSYNLTRLLAPLLFALFFLHYRKQKKRVRRQELWGTGIVSLLLLVPLVVTLFGGGGVSSATGTLIFSSKSVQAQLLEFRSYLVPLPPLLTKLFFNLLVLTKWQYFNNVASYFSSSFLFISGSPHGNHGIGNVGQFYLFELPLLLAGVYHLVRKRTGWGFLLLFFTCIVVLVASLTREAPHATRSFFLVAPLTVFSAIGGIEVLNFVQRMKQKRARMVFLVIFMAFAFYNVLYYLTSYYIRFPIAYAKAWRSEDKALSLYLGKQESSYGRLIIDDDAGFVYTSLLFFQKVSPAAFHRESMYTSPDREGFVKLVRFGKYEFRSVDWSKDLNEATLIVTAYENKPKNLSAFRVFRYPKRPVVISVKEKIAQYPVEEVAYVVIETR